MLVITRYENEKIVITHKDGTMTITVTEIGNGRCKICFDDPTKEFVIKREELLTGKRHLENRKIGR